MTVLRCLSVLAVLPLVIAGCAADTEVEPSAESEAAISPEMQAGPATAVPESVQLIHDNGRDYCTGVLVAPKIVLGAGHCIWDAKYTVRAPYAPGKPSAHAVSWAVVDNRRDRVPESRDIGLLILDKPINLATFPTLTQIGADADAGKTYKGVAIGHKREDPHATLVRSKVMTIKSGKPQGYTNGLRGEYYSEGGDSGGPLFLYENGQVTHKLVGIERQPEPSRNADWFTRIDAKVVSFIDAHR
jgi:hypothetical protein